MPHGDYDQCTKEERIASDENTPSGGSTHSSELDNTIYDRKLRENKKNMDFDFSTSDFAKTVKTQWFVDKTLMLKHIFSGPNTIVISAPRGFGKSTNLDMIKRFLEIQVDEAGQPKVISTTENYRLFKDNNLEIWTREHEFCNEYFGKYPVLRVDLKPLKDVRDFEHMLDVFKHIVRESYYQHGYLLKAVSANKNLDISELKKNIIKVTKKFVDENDLLLCFEWLVTNLHRFFGQKVFVLIDNYDAYVINALSLADDLDVDRILNFFQKLFAGLIVNTSIEQMLLVGLLPLLGRFSRRSDYEYCVSCEWFTKDSSFYKYFGISSNEVDVLLQKVIEDEAERHKVATEIGYYSCYMPASFATHEFMFPKVYCTWSVLHCIYRREVQNFGYNRDYCSLLSLFFKDSDIRKTLARLLTGTLDVTLDLSDSLSITDILKLKKILEGNNTAEKTFSVENKLLSLLYHLGHATAEESLQKGRFVLKIQNHDLHCELAKNYLDKNQTYNGSYKEIENNILTHIGSLDGTEDKWPCIEAICKYLHSLSGTISGDDVLAHLFIIMTAKREYITQSYCEFTSERFSCILLQTVRAIVCIIAKHPQTVGEIEERGAEDDCLLKRIFCKPLISLIVDKLDDIYPKIVIDIGCKTVSSNVISAAYCYVFESQDMEDPNVRTFRVEM